jgi:hypothetical protein
MRLSVGCFGLFIGLVTAAIWSTVGFDLLNNDSTTVNVDLPGLATGGTLTASDAFSAVGAAIALASASDTDAAREAMLELAATGHGGGIARAELRESLMEAIPEDAAWADEAPALIEGVLDEVSGTAAPFALSEAELALADEVAALSTEEALRNYAALLETDSETARRDALRARLSIDVAGDTLGALASRIVDLEDESAQGALRVAALNAELDEENSGGLLTSLRDFLDELGFGFGWASLYLTIMLSWWNGQTVGKKFMRIRVVRLDGEPVDWWVAFERGGGYAAGFATGLLGFAQVYWDANRQAIHDHIVGTVVVIEGAEKVGNWEEAL